MRFVYFLFAMVTVGVGVTLLPAVKTVSTAIYDAFGGTENMDPFLTLIVQFWPVIITLAVFFGAAFIMRTRQL